MSRINRKARRRIKRRAIKDVGIGIARCMLVRALRQGGMHHAIAGSPCVVGIIVERPGDLDLVSRAGRLMFQRMLRDVAIGGYKVLDWEDGSKAKRNAKYDGDAADVIATNSHVFGVAADAETFPPVFRLAADGFVTVRAADASAIVAATRSIGLHDVPEDLLALVSDAPLALLGAVIRPGRHSKHVIRGIERLKDRAATDPVTDEIRAPQLEDLHGFGDAAVWGLQLAEDLAAFKAGKLPWSDVDRGVLLSGPTGTGKTTFAQALARNFQMQSPDIASLIRATPYAVGT